VIMDVCYLFCQLSHAKLGKTNCTGSSVANVDLRPEVRVSTSHYYGSFGGITDLWFKSTGVLYSPFGKM